MDSSRLATMPFFAELSPDDLERVAEKMSEVDVPEGAALVTQGDFGHALYAIEEGTAEVSSDGTSLRTLGPGDVFGEIAVLASGRRTADVTASSPMRLLTLFKRDVWALERDCPGAAKRLRALIDERRARAAS